MFPQSGSGKQKLAMICRRVSSNLCSFNYRKLSADNSSWSIPFTTMYLLNWIFVWQKFRLPNSGNVIHRRTTSGWHIPHEYLCVCNADLLLIIAKLNLLIEWIGSHNWTFIAFGQHASSLISFLQMRRWTKRADFQGDSLRCSTLWKQPSFLPQLTSPSADFSGKSRSSVEGHRHRQQQSVRCAFQKKTFISHLFHQIPGALRPANDNFFRMSAFSMNTVQCIRTFC